MSLPRTPSLELFETTLEVGVVGMLPFEVVVKKQADNKKGPRSRAVRAFAFIGVLLRVAR